MFRWRGGSSNKSATEDPPQLDNLDAKGDAKGPSARSGADTAAQQTPPAGVAPELPASPTVGSAETASNAPSTSSRAQPFQTHSAPLSTVESRNESGGQLSKSRGSSVESFRRLARLDTASKRKDFGKEKDTAHTGSTAKETSSEPVKETSLAEKVDKASSPSDKGSPKAAAKDPSASDSIPKIAADKVGEASGEDSGDSVDKGWYSWTWKVPQATAWLARRTPYTGSNSGSSENSDNDEEDPSNPSDKKGPDFQDKSKEGGGWAFWARRSRVRETKVDEGELAISGTDTADHPREVTLTESEQQQEGARKRRKGKAARPSQVVPAFDGSFEWQTQSARFISSLSRVGMWHNSKCYRTTPVSIRKVVVVGVHGYFPARVARAILGEPKGTSIKFANEAAQAVEEWAARTGQSIELEKIALEGEGRIQHRVDTLYRLLLNWQNLIREADFIFFAVHSQGFVVTAHIVSRLIEDGFLQNQRVGMLGMAGVCLGPMPGMDQTLVMRAISTIEHDSLIELFQLQNIESPLAKSFAAALVNGLRHGVKVVLVGSANDQLVPLYSALCAHIDHPNIYRAAYIDGEDVGVEVIAPLLSLALRRRNLGQSDHGLVVELSNPLAGAYTGGGHSKLYSDQQVYDIAVANFLETSPSYHHAPTLDLAFRTPHHNPYVLPWALHAVIADSEGKPLWEPLLRELYDEFKLWRPDTKPMKELKYRLGALQHSARL